MVLVCVDVHGVHMWTCDLHAILTMQTKAKSVPHPGWEKTVYFVCSSFNLRAPAAGDKWSTQKELHDEAKLEVQEVMLLVQEYINRLPPKRGATSVGKTASDLDLSERDLSSICVMFPTRLTVSA